MTMLAVEYALSYGWSDEAVADLEQSIAEQDLSTALAVVTEQDLPESARQQLMALIVLAVVS